MFELVVALRYLLPRKKSLSTAIVSLLSIVVISLVVWLVLVFLSVTAGIERNWLQKLTSLHAPIRITPTERYYSSYYYQIDSLSAASSYSLKTIGEKAEALTSDPYAEQTDAQIPVYWPTPERNGDGRLRDPVKEALSVLEEFKLPHQDYEIGGALLRLSLNRPTSTAGAGATLSQMSYLLSLMEQSPHFASLILSPSVEDLDALLKTASHDAQRQQAIFANIDIEEVKIFSTPLSLFPEHTELLAFADSFGSHEVQIPLDRRAKPPEGWREGKLMRVGSGWQWRSLTGETLQKPFVRMQEPFAAKILTMPNEASSLSIEAALQGIHFSGEIKWEEAALSKAKAKTKFDQLPSLLPPWAIEVRGHCHLPSLSSFQPFLLPKTYREMGVRIGDRGTLSFATSGAASSQEQRISVQVAGFYDPGLFSLGGRCLIVPPNITRTVHAASQTFSPDGSPTNGIFVWNNAYSDAENVKDKIEARFFEKGLLPYWKISTYKDFEFSKELFQQFRSDRTLFTLIAVLILLVACCNIISLLVLLVNDKKREIAILQAMGASGRSVAAIFGCCGLAMGALSCLLGTGAAIFTLRHLDVLVKALSALQGHAAFQPAFFGQTLPNQLSGEALLFVIIATPLLSLLAGLIPALRASRIRPALALRQE